MKSNELYLILTSLINDHLGLMLFLIGIFLMGMGRQYAINMRDQKNYPFSEVQYLKLFLATALFLNTDQSIFPETFKVKLKRSTPIIRIGFMIAVCGVFIWVKKTFIDGSSN